MSWGRTIRIGRKFVQLHYMKKMLLLVKKDCAICKDVLH